MPSSPAISELSPTQKALFAMNKKLQAAGWDLVRSKVASGEYVVVDGKYYTAAELARTPGKN